MKIREEIVFIVKILVVGIMAIMFAGCKKSIEKISDQLTGYQVEYSKREKIGDFWEYTCSTPNVYPGKNSVKAIVLHHTATPSTEVSLQLMADPKPGGKVSCHVVIAPDGTRYVLAPPTARTWHAGYSRLNGREWCNNFTVGIEFQGNTLEHPLTEEQIRSAIEYCRPIMKKYKLTKKDIVTHQQIRDEYIKAHPGKKIPSKGDITPEEYQRFLSALR